MIQWSERFVNEFGYQKNCYYYTAIPCYLMKIFILKYFLIQNTNQLLKKLFMQCSLMCNLNHLFRNFFVNLFYTSLSSNFILTWQDLECEKMAQIKVLVINAINANICHRNLISNEQSVSNHRNTRATVACTFYYPTTKTKFIRVLISQTYDLLRNALNIIKRL